MKQQSPEVTMKVHLYCVQPIDERWGNVESLATCLHRQVDGFSNNLKKPFPNLEGDAALASLFEHMTLAHFALTYIDWDRRFRLEPGVPQFPHGGAFHPVIV